MATQGGLSDTSRVTFSEVRVVGSRVKLARYYHALAFFDSSFSVVSLRSCVNVGGCTRLLLSLCNGKNENVSKLTFM